MFSSVKSSSLNLRLDLGRPRALVAQPAAVGGGGHRLAAARGRVRLRASMAVEHVDLPLLRVGDVDDAGLGVDGDASELDGAREGDRVDDDAAGGDHLDAAVGAFGDVEQAAGGARDVVVGEAVVVAEKKK